MKNILDFDEELEVCNYCSCDDGTPHQIEILGGLSDVSVDGLAGAVESLTRNLCAQITQIRELRLSIEALTAETRVLRGNMA